MKITTDRHIDLIVIHCSDTYPHMDIGTKEITQWHQDRGWSTIGYHFVIRKDGTIEEGRNLDLQGAHCKGYNKNSIGICLIGGLGKDGLPSDNFTRGQFRALAALLVHLETEYPEVEIKGHYELNSNKACPSFNVEDFLDNLDIYLFD